jgi:hypothetical protein
MEVLIRASINQLDIFKHTVYDCRWVFKISKSIGGYIRYLFLQLAVFLLKVEPNAQELLAVPRAKTSSKETMDGWTLSTNPSVCANFEGWMTTMLVKWAILSVCCLGG